MGTISKSFTFSAGATVIASEHNDNFDTLYQEINGQLQNVNIASDAAIVDTKLAQITTASKVSTSSITGTLGVANGGTGAATLTDGGILLGSGTGAMTAMSVLADGEIPVGDGTTDPVALAAFTSSTGTLKHESGGIEADISAVAKGGLIAGTGSGTMGLLAVGTNDQVLIADSGEASGVKWGESGIAATAAEETWSGQASSDNVTLVSDKMYLVRFYCDTFATNNISLMIRFNDSSAASYSFATKAFTFADPAVETSDGGTGQTGIEIVTTNLANTTGFCVGHFYVNTTDDHGNGEEAFVHGSCHYKPFTGAEAFNHFFGRWAGGAVTSMELATSSGNFSGNLRVYELS